MKFGSSVSSFFLRSSGENPSSTSPPAPAAASFYSSPSAGAAACSTLGIDIQAGCGPPDTGYTFGGANPNGAGIFGPSGGGGGTYVGFESPPAPFAASFFTTTVAALSFAFYKGF